MGDESLLPHQQVLPFSQVRCSFLSKTYQDQVPSFQATGNPGVRVIIFIPLEKGDDARVLSSRGKVSTILVAGLPSTSAKSHRL